MKRMILVSGNRAFRTAMPFIVTIAVALGTGSFASGLQKGDGAIKSKAVAANQLRLRDSDGRIAAALSSIGPGCNTLSLVAKDGQRVALYTGQNGFPAVDVEGPERVLRFGVMDSGSPHVSVICVSGPSFHLVAPIDGPPSFVLGGENGTAAVSIQAPDENGTTSNIRVSDRRLKTCIHVVGSKDVTGICLFGKGVTVRSAVAILPDTPPQMNFYDSRRENRVQITEKGDGSAVIRLIDPEKEMATEYH